MKTNRAHYESFIDHEGGEWIAMVAGKYKGIIWRPADLQMTEEGQISVRVEFLDKVVEDKTFDKVATSIIQEQLSAIAAQDQQLVDSFPEQKEREKSSLILPGDEDFVAP